MSHDHVGWLHELPLPERRLVCALRNAAIALDHESVEHRDATAENLAHVTGTADRAGTLRSFWSLVATLLNRGRRAICCHTPACPCLSRDEAIFLALCRHLRSDRHDEATGIARQLIAGDQHAHALLRDAAVVASRTVMPAWSLAPVQLAAEGAIVPAADRSGGH